MLAVKGYYDGASIQLLEDIVAKPNQLVVVTVMDEFFEPVHINRKKGMRGVLEQYADPVLAKEEEGAWEHAVVKSYGDV